MKKEPTSNTNKWANKIFFPRLLVTAIWRYAFPNSNRLQSSTAAKITNGLSIGYVLATSTVFGIGKFIEMTVKITSQILYILIHELFAINS